MSEQPIDDPSFQSFIADLHREAATAGITPNVVSAALANFKPDHTALDRNQSQPEHAITSGDYFNRLVSPARIDQGRQQLANLLDTLRRIETEFGIPASILVAIWGIESNFGQSIGSANVIQCLATLAHRDARRVTFWRRELLAALRILEAGDVAADHLVGSWAGAMGHTQFMPTTYLDHAIDFDGDGVRDIWHSIPDALASAANYLRHAGWQPKLDWGYAIHLTSRFDFTAHDPSKPQTVANWQAAGIVIAPSPQQLSSEQRCRLITPAGATGPAFLITSNFDAILTYNRSTIYALSVGCLADRIAGAQPLSTDWPTEIPLTRTERIELQQHLADAGLDTNGIDGILGSGTQIAARAYQIRHGLTADGHPSAELLRFMRSPTNSA